MSPLIPYKPKTFKADSEIVIKQANEILRDYAEQGFDLTLRQLYYQFVARDLLPNNDRSYKRLGGIVNDARLGGRIDWDHIVDRTRYVRDTTYWESPDAIIRAAARGFKLDKWETQSTYVEVWVEKDALVGVVQHACDPLEVSYLSCRGYVSQSEMWRASQRLGERVDAGQQIVVLHLGDHDPSGIDMSRDIRDRISEFLWGDGRDETAFELRRVALNYDQVTAYQPPPNPAKLTDSRARDYIARFGNESWELDALEPSVLAALVQEHVGALRDDVAWGEVVEEQEAEGRVLQSCHERWKDVAVFLNGGAT